MTEKHKQWQQNSMTIHNNGMRNQMLMTTIGGTTWDIKDKTYTTNHNSLHCQHRMPQQQQTIHQQSRLFLEYNTLNQLWLHMYKMACRTDNRYNRHYGRQWSSHTWMSTMVCTRVPNTTAISRQWTTTTHSDKQWNQTLRIQLGSHAQWRRTTNCHTILCVWRTSTHCISFKARGTRIQTYIWWRTT